MFSLVLDEAFLMIFHSPRGNDLHPTDLTYKLPVMGKRPHTPTPESRRLATILAGWGLSARQAAEALDVSHKTALKHYGGELADGAARHESTTLARHLNSIEK